MEPLLEKEENYISCVDLQKLNYLKKIILLSTDL